MLAAPLADAITGTRDHPVQTTPLDAACPDSRGGVKARTPGRRLWQVAALLRGVATPRGHFHDPLFGQPSRVEDDYYRFRAQPRG